MCDVRTAVSRFLNRNRHPGHLDKQRSKEELEIQFKELSILGPIGVGKCLSVDTSQTVDIRQLCEKIRLHFLLTHQLQVFQLSELFDEFVDGGMAVHKGVGIKTKLVDTNTSRGADLNM